MFRNTLMSTSDAVLLFDVGAGQVGLHVPLERPQADCVWRQAQGGRQFQEDRYTLILPDQFPANTDDKLAFFAIYDGQ